MDIDCIVAEDLDIIGFGVNDRPGLAAERPHF